MVDAVNRGEILLAYNVMISYAYSAQRAGSHIGVVLPNDYQSIQTRSVMIPRGSTNSGLAAEFIRFLTSPEGRGLARAQLMKPGAATRRSGVVADRLLAQASVSPLLLTLQDQARRRRMIREWLQAIRPGAIAKPTGS
jgi:iron(III) transport system substrate-binding protein